MKDIAIAVWTWMRAHLSPAQVCWICLFATCAVAYVMSTKYVQASEFSQVRAELRDMRSETIEDKVLMWWRLQCKESDDARKRHYWDSYVEKQRQLEKVRGSRVVVPSCEDV